VRLDLATVQTNIIVFHLESDAPAFVARAREHGVLLNAFGPRTVRAVTHLDVSAAQCDEAAQRLCAVLA
jgi:threonine aldolase